MLKARIYAVILIVAGLLIGYFDYSSEGGRFPFKLGLDLKGGTHLVYDADVSEVTEDVEGAMQSLQEVVDRRVNLFGVAEPIVQVEQGGTVGSPEQRLIVELPGVTDVEQAIGF